MEPSLKIDDGVQEFTIGRKGGTMAVNAHCS